MSLGTIEMTVRGQRRNVELTRNLGDNKYRARVRKGGNSTSVRGVAQQYQNGVWRFTPTNPENLY